MISSTSEFPSIAVPDSKKDKDYHLKWTRSIVSNTFTDSWANSYNVLKVLYQFFLEGSQGDLTSYLQTAPDGSQMPGLWISLNSSRTKLTNLIGELEERGYVIKAKALNSEAVARKFEERERLRRQRFLQPIAREAEELAMMPLQSGEYIPQTDQELDEYMNLNWKDVNVLVLETAVKWIAERANWDEKRKALFRDVLISNRAIVRNEIINGVPEPRRIDPLKFIFDPNATDDMLSDATYFGEVEYMPLAAAAERYGLSLDEIKEAYQSYEEYLGLGMDARGSHTNSSAFGCMPGQTLRWFKIQDGTPRCLVIRGVWRDYKTLANKYEENDKGKFLQDVSGDNVRKRDKDKIISKNLQCWRQGTIIGGTLLKEWGECDNQPRELSSLQISEPPYKVWVPDFLIGKTVSKLEQLVGLQMLKDIAMYQIQIQMARSVGKVIVFDEAMMPEGMTKESVISYIKADGVAWVNSKEYQIGAGNMNLFKEFDLSMSDSIVQAINIIQYCDGQMDSISGVNAERQGGVQGASTAVGVQQASIFQSNLNTAPYFRGFERFCSRVLNHQAKLVKIAWADKEKFAPIIGDIGIDFLKDNIDISLDEFDVIVQSLPPQTQDRNMLMQWIGMAVQAGEISIPDAMDIMLEPDLTVAVQKYRRKFQMRQRMQQQQEQMAAQQEQALREEELAIQQEQLAFQRENSPVQLQGLKNKANLDKTLITSRTKLNDAKLKLLNSK
jgi:hypothetical protein